MSLNIHILPHLISVSFAVGLAYIALDRFRYTNRVIQLLKHALNEITTGIKKGNPAAEDSATVRLQTKIEDVSNNGLGVRFCGCGKRLFGVFNKSGWDIFAISFLLFLNFFSLCLSCFLTEQTVDWLLNSMFSIAIIGTLFPVAFIIIGKRHIGATIIFINSEYTTVASIYTLSVDEFLESLKHLPYT